jgi:hypothetical protein
MMSVPLYRVLTRIGNGLTIDTTKQLPSWLGPEVIKWLYLEGYIMVHNRPGKNLINYKRTQKSLKHLDEGRYAKARPFDRR